MWVVMKAYPWSALDTNIGFTISMAKGPGLPTRFLPVFESKEDAISWGADDDDIMQVTPHKGRPTLE